MSVNSFLGSLCCSSCFQAPSSKSETIPLTRNIAKIAEAARPRIYAQTSPLPPAPAQQQMGRSSVPMQPIFTLGSVLETVKYTRAATTVVKATINGENPIKALAKDYLQDLAFSQAVKFMTNDASVRSASCSEPSDERETTDTPVAQKNDALKDTETTIPPKRALDTMMKKLNAKQQSHIRNLTNPSDFLKTHQKQLKDSQDRCIKSLTEVYASYQNIIDTCSDEEIIASAKEKQAEINACFVNNGIFPLS